MKWPQLWNNYGFFLGIAFLLIVVTAIPPILGYLSTPPGTYYDGINKLSPVDFSLYLSYFEQIKQGNWLLEDLYTGEEQTPRLFNPFFLVFGLLGKLLNIPNIGLYHAARLIMIPLFLFALIIFLRLFFDDRKKLYSAVVLAAFGSGVGGWIAPFFGQYSYTDHIAGYYNRPMDLWVPEFNVFLTLYHNPLYIASLILILLTFYCFIKSIRTKSILWALAAGISGLILFLVHPYHIPTMYAVAALYVIIMVVKKHITLLQAATYIGVFILLSLPAAVFQVFLLLTDPIMYQRYHNTGGPPTVWWLTAISYGFLLACALPEIWRALKALFSQGPLPAKDQLLLFCLAWFAGGILLVYAPFLHHARRLTEGLEIPLVIFTTIFLFRLFGTERLVKLKKAVDLRIIAFILLPLLFGMSTLYVVAQDVGLIAVRSPILYIPDQTKQAMDWIKTNTTNDDVILTDLLTGNILPGVSGRHVFIGHTSETALYRLKQLWFIVFFTQPHDESFERKFLAENRITHILYTDALKKLSWNPNEKSYLKKTYANDGVTIYRVSQQ